MSDKIKNRLIGVITGIIIASPAIVFATSTILSGQIDYIPKDNTWNVENVEDALDDLYDMAKTSGGDNSGFIGYSFDYDYTGKYQTFTVPVTGEYKVELWGAQGGDYDTSLFGGLGGYTSGVLSLDKGDLLYLYIGEQASSSSSNTSGGWNGGGNTPSGKDKDGRAGGGATDVRIIPTSTDTIWNEFDSLKSRIMVAGAGGGAAYESSATWKSDGGAAGGLSSYIPANIGASANNNYGTIASQTSGGKAVNSTATTAYGSFGIGGNGISTDGGSGGGGGYYGGGGSNVCSGGAGGSSFISGHDGCDAISDDSTSTSIVHTGQSNHYSGIVFTNTIMIDGKGCKWTNSITSDCSGQPQPDGTTATGHSGNGHAKITYLG